MKKIIYSLLLLFISFIFVSCDFKLIDDNEQKGLEIDSLLQDMVTHKNIIYLISKDKIYRIHNNVNKLKKIQTTLKPIKEERADFISIKKIENTIYVLDENRKIYIWKIDSNDDLEFFNTIKLTNEATSFEVFPNNTILLANSSAQTELIDIEFLTKETDSYIKFSTIKKPIRSSYLDNNNNKFYAVGNLNKLAKYNLQNIKNIRQEIEKEVSQKINIISSNNRHLFLASNNDIFVYDFNLNKISSLNIQRVKNFLFDGNYLYLSRGLNGISKVDISNVENLKDIKYFQESNKDYKKILFSEDKKNIIIMLSHNIKMISKNSLKDVIKPPTIK